MAFDAPPEYFICRAVDYETALKAYAMDAADRKGAGLTDLAVLQLDDDPKNLLILWAVSDVARATAFFDSPGLAAHMTKNAGVSAVLEGLRVADAANSAHQHRLLRNPLTCRPFLHDLVFRPGEPTAYFSTY